MWHVDCFAYSYYTLKSQLFCYARTLHAAVDSWAHKKDFWLTHVVLTCNFRNGNQVWWSMCIMLNIGDIEVMNIIEGQLPHDKIKRHWKRQQCESILRTYCPSFKSTRKAEMIFVNEDKSFFLIIHLFPLTLENVAWGTNNLSHSPHICSFGLLKHFDNFTLWWEFIRAKFFSCQMILLLIRSLWKFSSFLVVWLYL